MVTLSWKSGLALGFGVGALASAIAASACGIVINSTPSEPLGIWRETPLQPTVSRGDMVVACPPDTPTMQVAKSRHYLPSGSCPGGLGTVMKQVVAVAGDTVEIRADGLLINGAWFSHAPLAKTDSTGRPLSPLPVGRHVLAAGNVFLASDYTPKSFDSRYFGPVSVAAIRGKLTPILVTEWKPAGF